MASKTLAFSLLFAITVLILPGCLLAQQFPDAPSPRTRGTEPLHLHSFSDDQNVTAISSSILLRAADAIKTCQLMSKKWVITVSSENLPNGFFQGGTVTVPYFHEKQSPVDSCAGIVTWNTSMTVIGVASSRLFHITGHHTLERFPNWISAAGSAVALVTLFRYHPKPPTVDTSQFPPGVQVTVSAH